ncbi:DUF1016 domain-containing protein [Granulicella sp. WH15]|nr:DUF1016 domain-containing protein [Granulicella sp. WH15]
MPFFAEHSHITLFRNEFLGFIRYTIARNSFLHRSGFRLGKSIHDFYLKVPLEVDGKTFYLDLVFYHVRLHCYFVNELKVGEFKPEYAGKLNFYLSAADDLLRTAPDAPPSGSCSARAGANPLLNMRYAMLQSR